MAHTSSAKKRIRQYEKRRLLNKSKKTAMKTQIKRFTKMVDFGDVEGAEKNHSALVKCIAQVASHGVIHKNRASRMVSRLTKRLNAIKAAKSAQ